jgi:hypothetical protein
MPSLAAMSPFDPSVLRRAVSDLDPAPPAPKAPEKTRGHGPFWVSLAAMGAGQAADAIETVKALQRPGVQESNPVYGDHPSMARIVGTKAATMIPTAVLLDKLYHHHPKIAMTLAGSIGALGAGLALHNRRQGRP